MVQIDMTEVLKDAPRGEWLALSHDEDRVLASSLLIEDAFEAARASGKDNPVMMKVPPGGLLVL